MAELGPGGESWRSEPYKREGASIWCPLLYSSRCLMNRATEDFWTWAMQARVGKIESRGSRNRCDVLRTSTKPTLDLGFRACMSEVTRDFIGSRNSWYEYCYS